MKRVYRRWRRSKSRDCRIGEELQFNEIGEKEKREEERRRKEGANVIIIKKSSFFEDLILLNGCHLVSHALLAVSIVEEKI